MSVRTAPVVLGDATVVVSYEVHGQHLLATMTDPEEWPEIELKQLTTLNGEDITGLLEFEPVYERCLEKITEQERDDRYYQDDDAYDRARDERLEALT